MSTDSGAPTPDVGLYTDDRPAEVSVEHNGAQTLVSVETASGSVVAAVDVGEIALDDTIQFGREVRDAAERLTAGGERDGA